MQLSTEERIQLRDDINEYLTNKKIIITHKNGTQTIHRRKNFIKELNNNDELKEKYNLYVQQFRSEEEAIYCIIHRDDFENHKCRICENICQFYLHNKKYNKTCGKDECKRNSQTEDSIERMLHTKEKRYGKRGYNNRKKAKETCERLYNNPNYTNRKKAKQTCLNDYGKEYYVQTDKFKKESKKTKLERYNDENYTNRKKAYQTLINKHDTPYPMQVPEFKEHWRNNYQKNNNPNNLIKSDDIIKYLNKFNNIYHQNIQIHEIYGTDKYFIKFIKHLHKNRKRLLKLKEIANIFRFNISQTIKIRAKQLNLLKYFDIHDSELEIQFEDFLIENNIKSYNRKNHILQQENGYYKEIDFLIGNIGFEINDIITHNSKQKDQYYHYNKTLQCKEKGIRLIHLWEWELTDKNLRNKIFNWILNFLDNKIQIDIKDCIIKEVNQDVAQKFISNYNLYDYNQFDITLGLYYNNKLLQVTTFKCEENNNYQLLQFCTKFGYNVKNGIKELINYFVQTYNPQLLTTIINLDKFTGKTFEELGFKLTKYKEPQLISHDNNSQSSYKSIYNCGQNIYQLNLN